MNSRSSSRSVRFQTTTRAAQEAALVEQSRQESLVSGGREAVVRRLQEQKERNTRTNLVMGTDSVVYESTAAAGLREPLERDPAAFCRRRAPAEAFALKQALQRPHFYLGDRPAATTAITAISSSSVSDVSDDDEEEEGDRAKARQAMYVPASLQPDPTGELEAYRGQLNADVKRRICTSSVHWGKDGLSYETTQRAFFQDVSSSSSAHDKAAAQHEQRRQRAEIAALKRALTATHFRIDDGGGAGIHHHRQQPRDSGLCRSLLPPVKTRGELRAELGSSHFTLSEAGAADPDDRKASVMAAATAEAAAAAVAGVGGGGLGEGERERARELKRELTASRIVLGADPAYA